MLQTHSLTGIGFDLTPPMLQRISQCIDMPVDAARGKREVTAGRVHGCTGLGLNAYRGQVR